MLDRGRLAAAAIPNCLNSMAMLLLAGFLEKFMVEFFEYVREAQHPESFAITDGPNLQVRSMLVAIPMIPVIAVARDLVKALITRELIDGQINAGSPAS
jgi:hypothetical protein